MTARMAVTSATLAFTYKTSPPRFSIRWIVAILALTGSSAGWLPIHCSQEFLSGTRERPTSTSLAPYRSAKYCEMATPILPRPPVMRYAPFSRNDGRCAALPGEKTTGS